MRSKRLIEVTVTCHTCHKWRVRRAIDDDELDVDQLTNDTIAQLKEAGQCPHDKTSLEIDVAESKEKNQRRKVRYV